MPTSGSIGTSVERVGGIDRVTGAQKYTADLHVHHALQVKLVHVNCAHARILDIDTADAERVEGVRYVLSARRLPQPMPKFGPTFVDRPVIADGEVRFFGEPVAAVAAETEDAAEEAASLVRIDVRRTAGGARPWMPRMAPGAPLVRDPATRPTDKHANSNILESFKFGWGDVDAAKADCIVEHDYEFPMVTHFAIEPHAYHRGAHARGRDDLEPDPASVRAAACRGRRPWLAGVESPNHRARSGRCVWRKRLAEVRAHAGVSRVAARGGPCGSC